MLLCTMLLIFSAISGKQNVFELVRQKYHSTLMRTASSFSYSMRYFVSTWAETPDEILGKGIILC